MGKCVAVHAVVLFKGKKYTHTVSERLEDMDCQKL